MRLSTCAALAVLVSTQAWAQVGDAVVRVFNDKGSVYVRALEGAPLIIGDELVMVNDAKGTKAAGRAFVMELAGPLARLALDDEATAAKARFVRLPSGAPVPAPAPAPAQVPAAAIAPVAPALPPAPAVPADAPRGPALKGHIEQGAMRVTVFNESDTPWSGCELRYSDGRTYKMTELAARSDDGVMVVKFRSPPGPPEDHLRVRCDEGETRFYFANPSSPGALKGYVEGEPGGRVTLHNSSDKAWNRCDVARPNGEHYVLGTLKAGDHESIRSGLFKKEADALPTWVRMQCAQGYVELPLP